MLFLTNIPSVLIGLTLAVDEDFKVLFIVLVFHRTSLHRLVYIPFLIPFFQKPLKASELALVWLISNCLATTTGYRLLAPSHTDSPLRSVSPSVWVSEQHTIPVAPPLRLSAALWIL